MNSLRHRILAAPQPPVPSISKSVPAPDIADVDYSIIPIPFLARNHLSEKRKGRVRRFVLDNITRVITLDELADVAFMSRFHFSRTFRYATGITPIRYVAFRRVELAVALLSRTFVPLSEVAAQCGFCDQPYMTKVFKEFVGMTPGQFRQKRHL